MIFRRVSNFVCGNLRQQDLQDKRAYFTYLQEMPLQASDCFIAGASSIFNLEIIHDQIEFLTNNKRERGKFEGFMHVNADHHDDQSRHDIESEEDIERNRRKRNNEHSHDR